MAIAVVGVAVLVALGSAAAYWLVQTMDAAHRAVAIAEVDHLLAAQTLETTAARRDADVRRFVLTGDAQIVADITRDRATIDYHLRTLEAAGYRQAPALRVLVQAQDISFATVRAAMTVDPQAARALWLTQTLPVQTLLEAAARETGQFARIRFEAERESAIRLADRSRLATVALVMVMTAALVLLGSFLYRTSQELVQARQVEQRQTVFQLLDQVPVGIFVTDGAGTPVYANQEARGLLGRDAGKAMTPEQLVAAYQLYKIGTAERYPTGELPHVRALAGEHVEVNDVELRRTDGDAVPLHVRGAPIHAADDSIAYAIVAFQDVRDLHRMADTDQLTGLLNRAAVQRAFARESALTDRSGLALSVAIIDLDRFKAINDRHGHQVGDDVLRATAEAVSRALRRTDLVARWGGEEIVVILPGADRVGARHALEHALAAVRALVVDGVGGEPVAITFSAGGVVWRPGETLSEAVARADVLLYAAKRDGRARIEFES